MTLEQQFACIVQSKHQQALIGKVIMDLTYIQRRRHKLLNVFARWRRSRHDSLIWRPHSTDPLHIQDRYVWSFIITLYRRIFNARRVCI